VRRLTILLAAFGLFAAPATAKTLSVGDRGKQVRAVQQRLGLDVDGIYGQATARAVRRFQRRHDLVVTGRVDKRTWQAMGFGATARPTESTGGARPPDAVTSLADAARRALGATYKAGGSGPDEFDCSGLVHWAAKAVGVKLPRSSFEQYKAGDAVARSAVAENDLVFFDTNGPGASDVGIATGPDTAISATTHGVREHPISGPYWGEHYVGARRIG
jgi:cell wall-associated NlpC family hydrolase